MSLTPGISNQRIKKWISKWGIPTRWTTGGETIETVGVLHRRQTERNRGQKASLAPEGEVPHQNLSLLIDKDFEFSKLPEYGREIEIQIDGTWSVFHVDVVELASNETHYCILLNEDSAS